MPDSLLLSRTQIQPLKPKVLSPAGEQTQTDRLTVHRRNRGDANIQLLIVRLKVHTAVLGKPALSDIHMGHHFESRDDGRVQQSQLGWDRNFVKNPVDAIPDSNVVLKRLDVNVGR